MDLLLRVLLAGHCSLQLDGSLSNVGKRAREGSFKIWAAMPQAFLLLTSVLEENVRYSSMMVSRYLYSITGSASHPWVTGGADGVQIPGDLEPTPSVFQRRSPPSHWSC